MSANEAQLKCNWRDGESCQFKRHFPVNEWESRTYCSAHMPLGSQFSLSAEDRQKLISKHANLRGVSFPANPGSWWSIDVLNGNELAVRDLRDCIFANGANIDLRTAVDLSRSTFSGSVCISRHGSDLICRDGDFAGEMQVTLGAAHQKVDWQNSIFRSAAKFMSGSDAPRQCFDNCTFYRAPEFSVVSLAQQTTFTSASFERTAITGEDEGKYRKLRNLFHANRARDLEGYFYGLEKRCQRAALPRHYLVPRLVSFLYDKASIYGYSYARPFLWLICVQVIFAIFYGWRSGRLGIGSLDVPVMKFTLAQLVKPYEFFALRPQTGLGFEIDESWLWPVATLLHSTFSLALVAMMLLALRWRFRRD